jgi:hypothetical protein
MELAHQKSDLSVEDITNCQREIDDIFRDWVKLHGLASMTNYIQMLGSGHITECMSKWKTCTNTPNRVGRPLTLS